MGIETITHNLIAVIIQILCLRIIWFPLNIIFIILFTFISHIFIDTLSILTYHTPEAQKDDMFWVMWHILIYSLSIISTIFFLSPFWLGLLFANIIDIWDWLILRSLQKIKKKYTPSSKWGENLYIHRLIDRFRCRLFYWLPKWNYKKPGVIIEILIITISIITILCIL